MPRHVATKEMPDLTGYTVGGGRYLLDKLLGSGAYGRVYRAVDLKSFPDSTPARYAIKCMPIYDSGSTKAEFQRRELSHHPMVRDHANIVRFEKTFRDQDWIYLVMELVEGGDLFEAITEKQIFRNNDALVKEVYLQIIDALQFCHSKGIFHRDIKPENILCSEDGRHIKLADFGLSTRSMASAEYGCGSCYYMSPECIAQKKPRLMYSSKHTDVWSMGVVLVNMVSGRNPWRYATQDDQCYSAYLRDPDFLGNVLPISAEANGIIKRIFAIDPFERITLEELREEVTHIHSFFRISPPGRESIQPANAHLSPGTTQGDRHHSQNKAISSDEEHLFPSPVDEPPNADDEESVTADRLAGSRAFIYGSGSKPSDGVSSCVPSSKSSLAVKTPSVHAVDDVVVARPGGTQDIDVDDPLVLPSSIMGKITSKSATFKNGRNIIRAAVQRLKDFSSAPATK